MTQQNIRNYYIALLRDLKIKKCSFQTKIKLIEGLFDELKSLSDNPELTQISVNSRKFTQYFQESKINDKIGKPSYYSENQSTSYSFYSDAPSLMSTQNSRSDYEQKIMEKRMIKFQINEQIQALEDDLFETEKVVETKRQLNDDLAKKIQKKMKQIGLIAKNLKQQGKQTHLINSHKPFKNQHSNRDMMNVTISGASGFGFNKNIYSGQNSIPNTNRNQILINHFNLEIQPNNPQRKKAKSHYLNKSIGTVTGLFKNILK